MSLHSAVEAHFHIEFEYYEKSNFTIYSHIFFKFFFWYGPTTLFHFSWTIPAGAN